MWLSETAADTETLDTLAQLGLKFTILSPFQASRVRELGKRNWRDVNGGQIDPTRGYLARLSGGRTLAVFFYDGPVSQAVAFEKLLESGERYAQRLTSAFDDRRGWDQLVHIATDGESYGHHHTHGEMALAYALHFIESNKLARLTNYGEYLEKHPPTHEVQIHEKSAWSCSHGVGRWMKDCGCNSGGRAGWNQAWRAPLRNSLDWLRDEVAPLFEAEAAKHVREPWKARNDYIQVVLDRSLENRERFFQEHARRELNDAEKITVLKLLELQRHAMLMYTSCGWFFDEISGIESVQVVQYAARVIQLAKEVFNRDLESGFLERFEGAKSNIPENQDGRRIYEKFVKPAMIDWPKAVAHYGISSLFQQYSEKTRVFSFSFEDEHRLRLTAGKTQLAVGRTRIISEVTQESGLWSYAMLYLGEHNVTGGVGKFASQEDYDRMMKDIKAAYETADFPETMRTIDRHFGQSAYSLKSLFKDEQRRILKEILASTREDLESRFRLITERYTPLMKFLESAGAPPPTALSMATDLVLHSDIRHVLEAETLDLERLNSLIQEARSRDTRVLDKEISFVVKNRLERMIAELAEHPAELERVSTLKALAELVMPLPLGLNSWKVQNTYWEMFKTVWPQMTQRAASGDETAKTWVQHFAELGKCLWFDIEHLKGSAPPLQAAA
jgi:hypothetical protein